MRNIMQNHENAKKPIVNYKYKSFFEEIKRRK